jgi:hypothetical protein
LNGNCLASLLLASPLWQKIRGDPAWGPEGAVHDGG